jgi:hypothetical protein
MAELRAKQSSATGNHGNTLGQVKELR